MYADRKEWPLVSLDVGLLPLRDVDGAVQNERTLKPAGINAEQRARVAEVAEKTPVTLTLKYELPIQATVVTV